MSRVLAKDRLRALENRGLADHSNPIGVPSAQDRLVSFLTSELTSAQRATFTAAVSARLGMAWRFGNEVPMSRRLEFMLRDLIPEDRAARYLVELERRQAAGEPLVRAERADAYRND